MLPATATATASALATTASATVAAVAVLTATALAAAATATTATTTVAVCGNDARTHEAHGQQGDGEDSGTPPGQRSVHQRSTSVMSRSRRSLGRRRRRCR